MVRPSITRDHARPRGVFFACVNIPAREVTFPATMARVGCRDKGAGVAPEARVPTPSLEEGMADGEIFFANFVLGFTKFSIFPPLGASGLETSGLGWLSGCESLSS